MGDSASRPVIREKAKAVSSKANALIFLVGIRVRFPFPARLFDIRDIRREYGPVG
jgi:hypothetical protein